MTVSPDASERLRPSDLAMQLMRAHTRRESVPVDPEARPGVHHVHDHEAPAPHRPAAERRAACSDRQVPCASSRHLPQPGGGAERRVFGWIRAPRREAARDAPTGRHPGFRARAAAQSAAPNSIQSAPPCPGDGRMASPRQRASRPRGARALRFRRPEPGRHGFPAPRLFEPAAQAPRASLRRAGILRQGKIGNVAGIAM